MAERIWNRLHCPCFDLTWAVFSGGAADPSPKAESADTAKSPIPVKAVALVPGGGGSAKSGVKNQIHVMQFVGKDGFELLQSFETGSTLYSSISCASMNKKARVLMCATENEKGHIYELSVQNDGKISFTKKLEFGASMGPDGYTEGHGLNVSVVSINDSDTLASVTTGGDDGAVRVWKIDLANGEEWKATQIRTYLGHSGPVMALSRYPSKKRQLLCSGAKDGTCKIWDLSINPAQITPTSSSASSPSDPSKTAIVAEIRLADGTMGVGSSAASAKLECRGCQFSSDGHTLYLIQSAKTGSTLLVRYEVTETSKTGPAGVSLNASKALVCSPVPCTRLRVITGQLPAANGSDIITCDTLLAVGSCNGSICLFSLPEMAPMKPIECHDMPVTGLAFQPPSLSPSTDIDTKPYILLSCSVDNRLTSLYIPRSTKGDVSTARLILMLLLVLALMAALRYYASTLPAPPTFTADPPLH